MKEIDILKKYGLKKKTGLGIFIQVLLVICALAITIIGIIKSTDSWNRIVIYIGQALTCITLIIFGIAGFKKFDSRNFKVVIYSYAVLEMLRVAFLKIDGIQEIYAILAKIILVLITCDCVLFAERMNDKKSLYINYALIGLELLLYVVFLIGFPAVSKRLLFTVLPFVGILIAGSLCLYNKARIEQETFNKNTKK